MINEKDLNTFDIIIDAMKELKSNIIKNDTVLLDDCSQCPSSESIEGKCKTVMYNIIICDIVIHAYKQNPYINELMGDYMNQISLLIKHYKKYTVFEILDILMQAELPLIEGNSITKEKNEIMRQEMVDIFKALQKMGDMNSLHRNFDVVLRSLVDFGSDKQCVSYILYLIEKGIMRIIFFGDHYEYIINES